MKSNFQKYSDVEASSQRTGAETARRILDINGLYDVPVEPVRGTLTDHYDPTERVVRLSEPVYYGRSISAISVASHEVGHALRRSGIIRRACAEAQNFPVVNFASGLPLCFSWAGCSWAA
ncbi:zinc metallopeptidase [Bacillus velezensis]|nr:zinc metallopeptidase [Bacillus velezensis]